MKKIKLLKNQNLAKVFGILGVGGTIVAGSVAAGLSTNVDKVELLTNVIQNNKLDEFQRASGGDVKIVLGENHSGAIVRGKLFMWGSNSNGQLGLGDNDIGIDQDAPMYVPTSGIVTHLALGGRHSGAVVDGELYMWGSNEFGQLGLGDKGVNTDRSIPTRVDKAVFDGDIAQISLGANHSGVMTERPLGLGFSNTIFMWGDNQYGQLGLGDDGVGTERTTPEIMKYFGSGQTLVQLELGDNHSAALTQNSIEVLIWGLNKDGQLGQKHRNNLNTPEFIFIPGYPNFTLYSNLSLGGNHSGVVFSGELFMWGNNDDGQLGVNDKIDKLEPTKVPTIADNTVTELSLGGNHSGAIHSGKLSMWGSNTNGQLGLNNEGAGTERIIPEDVSNFATPTELVLGGNHSSASNVDKPFMWGSNTNGQLGLGDTNNRLVPTWIDAFQFIDITLNPNNDRDNLRSNIVYNITNDNNNVAIQAKILSLVEQSVKTGDIIIPPGDTYGVSNITGIGKVGSLTPQTGQIYAQITTSSRKVINVNFNGFRPVNDTAGITIPDKTAPVGTLAGLEINELVREAKAEPTGTSSKLAIWIINNPSIFIGNTNTNTLDFPKDAKITKVDGFELVSGIDGIVNFNIYVDKYYKAIGTNLVQSQPSDSALKLTNKINLKGLNKTPASVVTQIQMPPPKYKWF